MEMNVIQEFERNVGECYRRSGVRSIVAGISGGADSVALLLASLAAGVTVKAVHCNFHLRGDESTRDEIFVTDLCRRLGVTLDIVHFDVPGFMRANNVSAEMACRDLRYDEFRTLLARYGYDRIAVAHNADDNAETLLLNLMRGAGVTGLRGMLPDTGEIIRPLLSTHRSGIESYLRERRQDFVTDSTNLSCDYRRNFIRNRVIPLLETEWPSARRSILRSESNLRQEEMMLDWAEARLCPAGSTSLPYADIRDCPDPLWLVRRFAARFGGSFSQAGEMLGVIECGATVSGRQWKVSDGMIVSERDCLQFIAGNTPADTDIRTSATSHSVSPVLMARIGAAPLTELWTDLPPQAISFRHVLPGDRIHPLGMNGSSRISKIMKDAHLSRVQKECVVVAQDNISGEIIWAAGLKRSRSHLVSADSAQAWQYTVHSGSGETNHGPATFLI